LLHLDTQTSVRVGICGPDEAAMEAGHGYRFRTAWQANTLGDLGNGADRGVLLLVLRDEQDALGVADLGGERDVHARKDDGVVQRNEQQSTQQLTPTSFLGLDPKNI